MLKYMLDTNIIIYTIKNRPKKVRDTFNEHEGQMCISAITRGELIYGVENSAQPKKNLEIVNGLLSRLEIASFEEYASDHFGQLRAELYKKGKPIGPYDMLIAGHARAMGLILITNNTKEFERVPGLRIQNWA